MKLPVFSHFSGEKVVSRERSHIVYQLNVKDGHGTASVYPVLPGVEIVCLDIRARRYTPSLLNRDRVLELNHCYEGRLECIMSDGCLQYMSEGDLLLSMESNHSSMIELPLGYYRGIVVMLELNVLAGEMPRLLPEIPIDIGELGKRFFAQDDCFLIQAKEELRHIYSGMYTVPAEARSGYFRLKAMELLIYLYYFDPANEKQKKAYGRQQVETVKQIQKQITAEPGRRFTIEDLARQHCVSPTVLKSNFKGVYGMSIAAYMKEYRIRQAASLLRETQKSVAEIAAEMGYESQSKFGVAFKEIMKVSPLEYRKK